MPAPPFHVGFLLFDGLTQLDFTGPLQVLSRLPGAVVHLVARRPGPVKTDCGPFIVPSVTLDACPQLDLLCVPGGFGVDDVIRDREAMAWVRRQAQQARYVTSVCTGSFVLGAAGLLAGKRATTHWSYVDELPRVGATPVRARVVRDGRVFTGGGVTAGIDFAFTVMREVAGDDWAAAVQLGLEYDPAPPLPYGSPDAAPPALLARSRAYYSRRVEAFRVALAEAMAEPAAQGPAAQGSAAQGSARDAAD